MSVALNTRIKMLFMLPCVYLLKILTRNWLHRLLAIDWRSVLLLLTRLITGTSRTKIVFSLLCRQAQILCLRLLPVVPTAISVPYLMLRCPSVLRFETIWLKAGPLFPLMWNVLRTLCGLLTEMLMRKLRPVRKVVYLLLTRAVPARSAPRTGRLGVVRWCRNLRAWVKKLTFTSAGLLFRNVKMILLVLCRVVSNRVIHVLRILGGT